MNDGPIMTLFHISNSGIAGIAFTAFFYDKVLDAEFGFAAQITSLVAGLMVGVLIEWLDRKT